jgi:hypothetical protein
MKGQEKENDDKAGKTVPHGFDNHGNAPCDEFLNVGVDPAGRLVRNTSKVNYLFICI